MRRQLLALSIVGMLTVPAYAQEAAPPAEPAPESTAAVVDAVAAPAPTVAPAVTAATEEPPGDSGSNDDLKQKLQEVTKAYENLRGADGGKMALTFLLLAAIANLLISGIKRWRSFSDKGKKFLPWIALGLGIVAGFCAYFGTGAGLLESLFYGAGPATAVLIQELVGPIHSKASEASE